MHPEWRVLHAVCGGVFPSIIHWRYLLWSSNSCGQRSSSCSGPYIIIPPSSPFDLVSYFPGSIEQAELTTMFLEYFIIVVMHNFMMINSIIVTSLPYPPPPTPPSSLFSSTTVYPDIPYLNSPPSVAMIMTHPQQPI